MMKESTERHVFNEKIEMEEAKSENTIKHSCNPNMTEEFTKEHPLNEKIQNKKQRTAKRTFQQLRSILNNITVEPTICLFVIPFILIMQTTQNLSLEKACRVNLNFTDEICDSLKIQSIESQNQFEKEGQILFTQMLAWATHLTATIPCILALVIGSWSDKTGYRKFFIIYPIVGQILVCLNGIINTYFFYELKLEYLVFGEAIIHALTGTWCVIFLNCFAYIAAITTYKDRTFRMGFINFCMTVGFPIGIGISGFIIKNWGYYGSYTLAGILSICNCFYNIIFFKDPELTAEQKMNNEKGFCHVVRCFFHVSNIKDTIRVIFRARSNHSRSRLLVMLVVACILFGSIQGEVSIMYMSTRYRFSWNEVQFSIFQSYNFICHSIGAIITITYFTKKLQWHDSVIGVMSTVSKIAGNFTYAFIQNDKIFYIAPIVDIFNGTALLAMRSIVSKVVELDELGKVNSIISLCETLMPLIYIPLYAKVYAASMEVLPGAPFLIGAAVNLPVLIVFIFLFFEYKKQVRETNTNMLLKTYKD